METDQIAIAESIQKGKHEMQKWKQNLATDLNYNKKYCLRKTVNKMVPRPATGKLEL